MSINTSFSNNCSDGNTDAKADTPVEPILFPLRSSFFKHFNETIVVHSFGTLSSSRSMSINTSFSNNCSDGNTSAKAAAPVEPILPCLRSSFFKYFNKTIVEYGFSLKSIHIAWNVSSSNKRSNGKAEAKASPTEEPMKVSIRWSFFKYVNELIPSNSFLTPPFKLSESSSLSQSWSPEST